MDKLVDMIDNDNSYIRTRGLALIAYNAKWDEENKIDEIIDEYLKHIEDVKPITARQCIKLLPVIAKKPANKSQVLFGRFYNYFVKLFSCITRRLVLYSSLYKLAGFMFY